MLAWETRVIMNPAIGNYAWSLKNYRYKPLSVIVVDDFRSTPSFSDRHRNVTLDNHRSQSSISKIENLGRADGERSNCNSYYPPFFLSAFTTAKVVSHIDTNTIKARGSVFRSSSGTSSSWKTLHALKLVIQTRKRETLYERRGTYTRWFSSSVGREEEEGQIDNFWHGTSNSINWHLAGAN